MMENDFTNYDLLDKMIANNKRAKSWMLFWVITLCILAGAVLWMANDIVAKKRTIVTQQQELQTKDEFLVTKNKLIDSLIANCNGEKNEIVANYDSVIGQTQDAISAIVKPANGINSIASGISTAQKDKLLAASKSLKKVEHQLYDVKKFTNKDLPKIFVQYNNNADLDQINQLLNMAKRTGKYYVAPAEYINNRFPTVIKFYNHTPEASDKILKNKLASLFNLNAEEIQVKNEKSSKVKDVIEIWIGSKN